MNRANEFSQSSAKGVFWVSCLAFAFSASAINLAAAQSAVVDAKGKPVGNIIGAGTNTGDDSLVIARSINNIPIRMFVKKTGFVTQAPQIYFENGSCTGPGYMDAHNYSDDLMTFGYPVNNQASNFASAQPVIFYASGTPKTVNALSFSAPQFIGDPSCLPTTGSFIGVPVQQFDASTLKLTAPFAVK